MTNKRIADQAAEIIDKCNLRDYKNLNTLWVAKQLDVSRAYLSRTFKKQRQICLKEYIEKSKVERAFAMLVDTDKPISRIAKELDYSDSAYFANIFRKYKRATPKMVRVFFRAGIHVRELFPKTFMTAKRMKLYQRHKRLEAERFAI